jgi:hypothetical protein
MGQRAQRARIVPGQPVPASSPKLLDRVRDAIRARHYSIRTEEAYVGWVRRFIVFHKSVIPRKWASRRSTSF